ncbi:MAG: hypothetical protein ACYTGH_13820 [Planctomycetota bacterium]
MSERAETVNPDCPCSATGCPNHKHCDPCREKHYAKGGLPSCERPKQDDTPPLPDAG